MKKTFAIVMALVLTMVCCASAMAASLTITNAYFGEDYVGYKMLGINTDGFYTVEEAWADFFAEGAAGAALINDIAADGTLTTKADLSDVDIADIAEQAIAYAKDNGIEGTTVNAGESGVAFADLANGYYLVDSPVGVLDMLYNVTGDREVTEKHESLPQLSKVIVDGSAEVKANSADLGETITFKTTVAVEKGGVNYVVHDKMADGFTFGKGSVSVMIGTEAVDDDNYEIVTELDEDDCTFGCTFHVEFNNAYIATLQNKQKIDIVYTAALNSKASAAKANKNEAWLTYADTMTAVDWTETYTGNVVVDKFDGKSKDKLEGAQFKLYKMDGENKLLYFKSVNNVVSWVEEDKADVFTTATDSVTEFFGIAAGTYYLVETVAPTGYNLLAGPIEVEIDADGTSAYTGNVVPVENNTGSALPETGGIGTTIFYVIGGLLMAVAVVLLVTKKKTSGNK